MAIAVNRRRNRSARQGKEEFRDRQTDRRSSEKNLELIPETRPGILKRTVCYS